MKKAAKRSENTEMRKEYDFSKGIRGKYSKRYQEGVSIDSNSFPDVREGDTNTFCEEKAMTKTISIEFPVEVFSALRKTPIEFAKELRLAAAIHWYHQGIVSGHKAGEIAGMTRLEFLDELARRKLNVFLVDMEQLQEEIERE